ncbi:MAG: signal peptidase II [Methylocystaceae bacterium]
MRKFWLALALVVGCDQLVKFMVESRWPLGEGFEIIPGLLDLVRVHNAGAAFGMLPGQGFIFVISALIVVVIGIYLALRGYYPPLNLAMGIIAGGAVGNLIDRLRLGYVIDYINVSFFPPVFNLADTAITAGTILLFLVIWQWEDN